MFGKGTLNKVMLMGRLGADPEIKYTPNGKAVTTASLATNRVWKDQSGEKVEKTESNPSPPDQIPPEVQSVAEQLSDDAEVVQYNDDLPF